MVYKADKLRLRKLLMDAISLLCKNGLPVQSAFRIEATIGITLSEDEVVLVSFREVVQPDGVMAPQPLEDEEDEASDEASSVLSHRDDLDLDRGKKAEDRDRPSQAGDESGAWDSANSNRGQRPSVGDDSSNCPRLVPFDDVPRIGLRSRSHVQIKDEIVEDDEDCTFVKMEEADGEAGFDPLAHDDSWMCQVYDETNAYGGELSQGQDYEDMSGGGLAPASNQSWSGPMRDVVRPSQPHRGGAGTMRGGGATRGGLRQSLPVASRSQDRSGGVARTLQSLCKTLATQAGANAPPGEPVFCHICGARLSSNATLVKHIKGTHLALSACQCDVCGQSFKWTMQLCRHRKRYHSNVVGGE